MSTATKRLSDDGLTTLVSVNGVEITQDAINRESGHYDGGTIVERQHQAGLALVVHELLRQRADQLGIGADNDDERVDAVIEQEVRVPTADEASCREYFEKNRSRFHTEALIEARHILLPAPPDDLDALESQRAVAETLIARLEQDAGAFKRLAREYSACPSAYDGGNLGQLSRGQTVREFEEKVFGLPEGLATRPVETRYGWHVVDIVHRVDGAPLPFETVRERIAEYLIERSRRRAYSQYVRLLAADATVEGIDMNEADSPLVQ